MQAVGPHPVKKTHKYKANILTSHSMFSPVGYTVPYYFILMMPTTHYTVYFHVLNRVSFIIKKYMLSHENCCHYLLTKTEAGETACATSYRW